MLGFLNPTIKINIPVGWVAGAITVAGTVFVSTVKLLIWSNNKKNGKKYVSKEMCDINRKVFEERFNTIFHKLDEHGDLLTEVRNDIKTLLRGEK